MPKTVCGECFVCLRCGDGHKPGCVGCPAGDNPGEHDVNTAVNNLIRAAGDVLGSRPIDDEYLADLLAAWKVLNRYGS